MKKIIFTIILIVFFTKNTNAFMPYGIDDFIIAKIEKVEEKDDKINIKINNFVNTELYINNFYSYFLHILDIFNGEINLKALSKGGTDINKKYIGKNLKINTGDIVAFLGTNGRGGKEIEKNTSEGILKIGCENKVMYITGTKDNLFGTNFKSGEKIFVNQIKKGDFGNEIKILKRVSKYIGCENLDTFFDKNRVLEDLSGKDFSKYFVYLVILIGFSLFLLIIIIFYIFKKFLGKK